MERPLLIDERIRARRIAVTRAQGRQRLRVLLSAVGVFALVGTAVALLHSPLSEVRSVDVRGAVHTTVAEVASAVGVDRHPLLVDLDTAAVQARVQALAWVNRASIQRRWPSTVVVSVTERRPVAQVQGRRGWELVDATGRVLAGAPSPWPSTVVLAGSGRLGAPGSELGQVARPLLVVAATLPAWLRSRVSTVSWSGAALQLGLVPRGAAVLGDDADLSAKYEALLTMLTQVGGATVYNIEVPAAPALTR